jgi:hypothetical protein
MRKHVVPAPIAYINKGEKINICGGAILQMRKTMDRNM